MDKDEAHEYLSSLLNQNLRVVTTDGRLFWGSFKCTDAVRQIPFRFLTKEPWLRPYS